MLTIAAIAPVPALLDPASARPGGEGEGFAPVLAALLTPGEAAAVARSVRAAKPDAPTHAFPSSPLQAGTPLPPPCTPAPLAAALMPIAAPTLVGEQPATNDARLLLPSDVFDALPGERTEPTPAIAPQRDRARAEQRRAAFTTVAALPLPRRTLPTDDRRVPFMPAAVRTQSSEQPVEADAQSVSAGEPDADAMSACTPPPDPAASAIALPACPGDASPTATLTSAQAHAPAPTGRGSGDRAPAASGPVDRDSPARPVDGSAPSVTTPRPEVATPRTIGPARADRTAPDTNSADAAPSPVQPRPEPERKMAVPLARDPASWATPDPIVPHRSAIAEEPALSPMAGVAVAPPPVPTPRPAPVTTAISDPVAHTLERTTAQPDITPPSETKQPGAPHTAAQFSPDMAVAPAPASARTPRPRPPVERADAVAVAPPDEAIGSPRPHDAVAARAIQPSSDLERAAVTPVLLTAQPPVSPRPPVGTPSLVATSAPITAAADQAGPAPASSVPAPGAPAMAAEPVAPTGPPAAASVASAVADATRPASTPTGSPAAVDARPTRGEPIAGIAPATPAPPAPPAAAVMPAFQAFGAALHRAAAAERRPTLRDTPDLLVGTPVLSAAQPIAPIVDPTPLDTTQARWPDAMIGRIEQLRDLANEGDTRIRLHPDALGTVDVALRREGDAVRVHFTAAEPATRLMLADAQPRLQELAEAKGLKLSGAPLDSGSSNTGERRQPSTPQPALPARPRASAPAQREADADTRLA